MFHASLQLVARSLAILLVHFRDDVDQLVNCDVIVTTPIPASLLFLASLISKLGVRASILHQLLIHTVCPICYIYIYTYINNQKICRLPQLGVLDAPAFLICLVLYCIGHAITPNLCLFIINY